jgi:hypothetical protein
MNPPVYIPGGWYCDAIPGGAQVALVGSALRTDRGLIQPPPGNQKLLFVRMARDGIRFAGQGHQDGLAWLWSGSGWSSHGVAVGVNPVIFDKDDNLVPSGPKGQSQGWRYLADDGSLVTGDSTYANAATGLYEYTTHADVTIGQGGDEEGCQALVAGRLVLLEPGVCRFIRFRRDGDHCAVAFYKTPGPQSVILRFTRAELDALPTYVRPASIPAIGRPTWMGFFNFSPAHTPGNCVLNVSDKIVRDARGAAVAIYVAADGDENNIDALDAAIAAAKPLGLPIIPYWTRQAQMVRLPKDADQLIMGVEFYPQRIGTLAGAEAFARASIAKCKRAIVIAQSYLSNTRNWPDLAPLVPMYARVAHDCQNVVGVLAFSGYGRATGLSDHPEVLPLWQQLADGIPGAPVSSPSPLTITITDYSPKAGKAPLTVRAVQRLSGTGAKSVNWRYRKAPSTAWQTAAVNVPDDPDHHFWFTVPGTYEIGVDVIDQVGRVANGTKTPRYVEVS